MHKRYITAVATMAIMAVPIFGFIERQAIFDALRLRGYVPSENVVQLATDTAMLDRTRQIFYVYHPSIEEKSVFNQSCRDNEQTIVLGCYVDGKGIHILNIDDVRLTGVEQVTAAHETLHALYARLSKNERKRVDAMTAAAFKSLTDQRVKDTIELYRKQDPTIVPNELHSILGTEVRVLPAELEAYYKQYFSDRSKTVGFSEQYEQAFTERKNQIAAYDAELNSLKLKIDNLQNELTSDTESLSRQRQQLDSLRSDAAAYRSAVSSYNNNVNAYNVKIDRLTGLVAQYNDIVPRRNAIASEEQDLVKAIDSRESVPGKQ